MTDEAKLKIFIEAHNKAKQAFDEVNNHLDKTEKKFSSLSDRLDKMGSKMKDVGGKMTVGLTLPIVAAAGVSIKAFSDLQETINKVDVSFGSQSATVKEWAKTSIKSMGLAQQSALDATALFGDMGTGMGQTQVEASKMSMGLTQLGADMSSFKNVSFERAQTALAGIYTGETEALKGLGIVMTQTNLEEFARAKGINKSMSEMSQAELVQLRYAYVMDKTKNAQGDFARTSDGLANSTRMTKERMKELSAQLGEKLAPIWNKILEVGNKVLDWFNKLDDGTKKIILVIVGLLAVLGPLLIVLGSIATAIAAISAPMLIVIAVIAAVGLAIFLLVQHFGGLQQTIDKIKEAFNKLWEIIGPIIMPAFNALKDTVVNNLLPALQRLWDLISPVLIPALKIIGIIIGVLIVANIYIFINVLKIVIDVLSWVIDKFATLIQWIITAVKWYWNFSMGVKDAMVTAYNWVADKVTGIINWFKGIGSSIGNALGNVANTISAPFKTAFNAISNFWNSTAGKLSFKAPDWVPGIGGKGFDMPKLPTLYTGVRNFKGGPAVVGDVAGRGGEIVNLPRGTDVFSNNESKNILRSMANGGSGGTKVIDNGIVFNNYGNITNENAEASNAFWDRFNRISELATQGVPTNG
jgi:phage-related protein